MELTEKEKNIIRCAFYCYHTNAEFFWDKDDSENLTQDLCEILKKLDIPIAPKSTDDLFNE